MSNPLTIKRTEFKSFDGSTFGYRIYDNYGSEYMNDFDTPLVENDFELIQMAINDFPDFFDPLGFYLDDSDEHRGVYVDDKYYSYEQIKDYL